MRVSEVLRGEVEDLLGVPQGAFAHDFGDGFEEWWEEMSWSLQACELCSGPSETCIGVIDAQGAESLGVWTLFSVCAACNLSVKRPMTTRDALFQRVLATRRSAHLVPTARTEQ